ncbi:MAG: site-specific integrase [Acidobacteriaceae bacterium]
MFSREVDLLNQLVPLRPSPTSLPSVFTARPEARTRMRDFFNSHIRNRNTRRAYMEAVRQFSAFCAQHGIGDLAQVESVHVAAFVEDQLREHSKPTVKQRLAALRMLFDWMVVGQVLPVNPEQLRVELYADPLQGGASALELMRVSKPHTDSTNAQTYSVRVPATRPASDYTPRIIIPLSCARFCTTGSAADIMATPMGNPGCESYASLCHFGGLVVWAWTRRYGTKRGSRRTANALKLGCQGDLLFPKRVRPHRP